MADDDKKDDGDTGDKSGSDDKGAQGDGGGQDDAAALKGALDKERKARRDAEKAARETATELATMKASADASKSDQQKLEERLARLEGELSDAGKRALRAEVASEKNLPPKLATRLRGDTREELEADADELLEFAGNAQDDGRPRAGSFAGGQRAGGPKRPEGNDDMNDRLRSMIPS